MRLVKNKIEAGDQQEYSINPKQNGQWSMNQQAISNRNFTNRPNQFPNAFQHSWGQNPYQIYDNRGESQSYYSNHFSNNGNFSGYYFNGSIDSRQFEHMHSQNRLMNSHAPKNSPYYQNQMIITNNRHNNSYRQTYINHNRNQCYDDYNSPSNQAYFEHQRMLPNYQSYSQLMHPNISQSQNFYAQNMYPMTQNYSQFPTQPYFQNNLHQQNHIRNYPNYIDTPPSQIIAQPYYLQQQHFPYQQTTLRNQEHQKPQMSIQKLEQFLANFKYPEPEQPAEQHYTALKDVIDALACSIVTFQEWSNAQQITQAKRVVENSQSFQLLFYYLNWVMNAKICRCQLFNCVSLIYQLIFTVRKVQSQLPLSGQNTIQINQQFEESLLMHIQQNYPSNVDFEKQIDRVKQIDPHGSRLLINILCSISNIYLLSMKLEKSTKHQINECLQKQKKRIQLQESIFDANKNDSQFKSISKIARKITYQKYETIFQQKVMFDFENLQLIDQWSFITGALSILQKSFYCQKLLNEHTLLSSSIEGQAQEEPSIIYSTVQLIGKVQSVFKQFNSICKKKNTYQADQDTITKMQLQRNQLNSKVKKAVYVTLQSLFLKIVLKKESEETQNILNSIVAIFKDSTVFDLQEIDEYFCNSMLQTFDQFINGENSENRPARSLLFQLIKRQINFLIKLNVLERNIRKDRKTELVRFLQNIGNLLEIDNKVVSVSLSFLMARQKNEIILKNKPQNDIKKEEQEIVDLEESIVIKLA